MKRRTLIFLLAAWLAPVYLAQEGPKIFIESTSQPHQEDSLFFPGHTTTQGEMPPASAIEDILKNKCALCLFVSKREKADYVLSFSNGRGGYYWTVIDNSGDGRTLASKRVILEKNAYSDAMALVRENWSSRRTASAAQTRDATGAPAAGGRIVDWELQQNGSDVYEIHVNPEQVGADGVTIRLKIVRKQ